MQNIEIYGKEDYFAKLIKDIDEIKAKYGNEKSINFDLLYGAVVVNLAKNNFPFKAVKVRNEKVVTVYFRNQKVIAKISTLQQMLSEKQFEHIFHLPYEQPKQRAPANKDEDVPIPSFFSDFEENYEFEEEKRTKRNYWLKIIATSLVIILLVVGITRGNNRQLIKNFIDTKISPTIQSLMTRHNDAGN